MALEKIDSDAFLKLKELASWLYESAEMEEYGPNLFKCVDSLRETKARPLLEQLKIDKIEVI